MAWTGLTLTVDGRNALNQAQLSQKINFKSMVVGDGKAPENFSTLKGLVHPLYEITDFKVDVVEGGCILTADFPKVDYDYYFREIGVVVATTDGDKLYVYDNCGDDAQYIIASTGVESTQKRLRLSLKISDVNEITISSPSILYVAYDDFEKAVDVVEENKNNLKTHIENEIVHITQEERENWNEEIGEKVATFSQTTNRVNIVSGEKLKVNLGRIKKWFADLKTVAFTGSYSDLSNKPAIPAAVAVKGNAESAYRTGNVNLTPENIGAMKGITFNTTVDFNLLIDTGIYIINAEDNTSAPTNKIGVLFVYFLQGKTWQIYFSNNNTNNVDMYMRYRERYQWMSWSESSIDYAKKADIATKALQDENGKVITNTYLTKTGDTANNSITFSSPDESNPASWANVPVITSGEKHGIIFNKIVNMCRNVRYLYKILGTTSISSIGNGTVTGAISTINNQLSTWETLTMSEIYSGFRYEGGVMKYHPILKLAFISITFQATVETSTGNNIAVCRMQKSPSVNTALSARVSRNIGAINAVIFTGGNLSIATDRAVPADGYILCSGIYPFA